MAGDTGMAGKVALLLWAQTLGLAGAQTAQILVEPPWRPPVLWDQVTLTCQGSRTAGATTWYRDGEHWWQEAPDQFTVTEKGSYMCERPGTDLSPAVTVLDDLLVLQVPARALLEWDTVTLRCRGWWNSTVTSVSFHHNGKEPRGLHNGIELSLSPLQLSHSGRYTCKGRVGSWGWKESPAVTVTVQAGLVLQVPVGALLEGDTVTLRCRHWRDTLVTGVRFYRGDKEVERAVSGTELSLSPLQLNHSGHYSCKGWVDSGVSYWAQSAPVPVTVHELFSEPMLKGPPELTEGSSLNLSCLSTPSPLRPRVPLLHVFYRDGQVVGGPQVSPQLEVPAVGVSHSGYYSCQVRSKGGAVQKSSAWLRVTVRKPVANATISPSVLEVTPQDTGTHRDTVAAGVGGALLFLLLLVGVIVAWHRWRRVDARKHQERTLPAPPVEDSQAMYMTLQKQPWEPSDIYDNLQQKL